MSHQARTITAVPVLSLLLFAAKVSADPSPAPSPLPSPTPAVALHAVLSTTLISTSGINATGSFDSATGNDRATRSNVSNAFAIISKSTGTWQYALQGGAYSIPVVGFAGNKTIQSGANTDLYGPLPLAYLEYAPRSSFNVSAGVLATLIGAESTFTYQNWNIQRGAVWNVENAVSRGVRAMWTAGKLSTTFGANDGFYSGRYGAAEASLTFAPDPNDSLVFVWLDPNSRTPPNSTASVANKELLNVVFTRSLHDLQISPYILEVHSPSASALGYTTAENAFGAAILAELTLHGGYSAALRWETLHNSSATMATSANADLVGFGPGSGIVTWTLTPTWRAGITFARLEFSHAHVTGSAPGLAFGSDGNARDQDRVAAEIGIQI